LKAAEDALKTAKDAFAKKDYAAATTAATYVTALGMQVPEAAKG
jgi:hypothetical protein